MDKYNDIHRALLQYIISVRYLKEHDFVEIFGKLVREDFKEYNDSEIEKLFPDAILKINERLNPIGFSISKTKDQATNKIVYVYTNTQVDEYLKIATTNTINEIDLLKKLIDELFGNAQENYFMRTGNVNTLIQRGYNKSVQESEFFITKLVDEGWFEINGNGQVTPSIRLLTELKQYLIGKYGIANGEPNNDGKIHLCKGCSEIVTIGEKCLNSDCYIRFHTNCSKLYLNVNGLGCPNNQCSYEWPSNDDRESGILPPQIPGR